LTRQDNSTTLRNYKAVFREGKLRKALHPHIAGQIETICNDIESILSGDYKNLSIVCIGSTIKKMEYPSESFNEMIARGAFPGIGSFEAARSYALEAARDCELQSKPNDWALNSRAYEDGQRYTRYLKEHCKPQTILKLVMKLFPEMERSKAWSLAKEEHFRRLEVRRDISFSPDDWEADLLAEEAASAAIPTHEEEVGNSLGGWGRVAREIAWSKIYNSVFRSVMARLHRIVTNFFMFPRTSSRSRRSPVRSAAKSGGDDNGGDGDSDQGEPPRPSYTGRIIPPAPIQARQFLLTPKVNNFPFSRTPLPCRWPVLGRWVA
jgi:hypothetical protein